MADNLSSHKENTSLGVEKQSQSAEKGSEALNEAQNLTEGLEGIAEIIGEAPSENQNSGKNKASAGSLTKSSQGQQKKAALKPIKIPTLEVMRVQIASQVNKEIKQLEKEATRMMMNPAKFSPFKLNSVIAKIRELKDILANLAFVTVETLKGWWMKFVGNGS